MAPVGKAQYHATSNIKGVSTNKPLPNKENLLLYLGLSFCRSSIPRQAIPTQGSRLFIKAWHHLGKAQYHALSNIGRASTNKHLPNKEKLLPYLGHSFYRPAIPTQWSRLLIKA
ncbi:hypothetical protein Adt_42268 [Abeliophyllum distichum]|uniref:Uncharacterized protein n=1 Tax=Abeliophyllum distichum TaxID=126358 RepID=A0ABD1PS44_9LAMI